MVFIFLFFYHYIWGSLLRHLSGMDITSSHIFKRCEEMYLFIKKMDNKTVNFLKIVTAKAQYDAQTPMFFRRMTRWRNNAQDVNIMITKWGLFRGYMKYGIFGAYLYMFARACCKLVIDPRPPCSLREPPRSSP